MGNALLFALGVYPILPLKKKELNGIYPQDWLCRSGLAGMKLNIVLSLHVLQLGSREELIFLIKLYFLDTNHISGWSFKSKC